MKSRDLSRCTLISRIVSHFETTGSFPYTHGISEYKTASVASIRISSMPHGVGNPPLPSPNVPSPTLFYELSNADTPLPFNVEICRISFFSLRGNFQSSIPYSTINVHPYLTANEKAQTHGLICMFLKMANSRQPSMVFGCLRPMPVCSRSSDECWERCPWS